MRRNEYLPEGQSPLFPDGQPISALQHALAQQTVLTGIALRCDSRRNLHIRFGGYDGILPRSEAVHPSISGSDRDISVLSLVGKQICFTVRSIEITPGGKPILHLSRLEAQKQAFRWLLEHATPGQVLPGRVTHLASFGAFVDIGCGVIALLPLDRISFSRISHPRERFAPGQDILVTVREVDEEKLRFSLGHKELLGTWLQNAAAFAPGDTVPGIIRSVTDFGLFIELTPNLSGLADLRPGYTEGDGVSVFIRSIRPDVRRIKLQVVQKLDRPVHSPLRYFITDGTAEDWEY